MDAHPFISLEMLDSVFSIGHRSLRLHKAHLVGIAGNGMRALADVLTGWGWQVSGSDSNGNSTALPDRIKRFSGHDAENLSPNTDLVVVSDAVPKDNPELRRAAERGIPTLSYFETIGKLTAGGPAIAVAGAHGKSTTTAMLASILVEAGMNPTVFCGAATLGKSSGGRAGDPRLLLVEACEYRANFLKLQPRCAAILGIEPDHFDCYDSLEQLENAFRQFAERIPADGFLLANHDCMSTRRATAGARCRIETFGTSPEANWSVTIKPRPVVAPRNGATDGRGFIICHHGQPFCEVQLKMPGRHNRLNALAAAALAHANGATADRIAAGLEQFPGLHRRLERLGAWRGVEQIDDYAHHPTEVSAALATIRDLFPRRRVWCVFQPHQASRTARLLDEFAESLQNADRIVVADIFRAREGAYRPGDVTAADLARRTAERGATVLPAHSTEEIVQTLEAHLVPGDVLVTLGAGDVAKLRPRKRD
jgi:UDP-N-acetylmuramate--alanine ligase